MRYYLLTILLAAWGISSCSDKATQTATTYEQEIMTHRQHYKEDFIKEERSPLKGEDTGFIRFFPINESYKTMAELSLTPESPVFELPTYSGKTKSYRKYGILSFTLKDTLVELSVYQSQKLIQQEEYKNHLFVPFTDGTIVNAETYGGGRYIDLSLEDVKEGKIELDFNKCYNPYCAYADGYSCPIPPDENKLAISIRAGEKAYGKEIEH